jgi:hypothetical protein
MRNDGHFGQLKMFSKTVNIFGWNVLRSIMFQIYFRKIHQIPKLNFAQVSWILDRLTCENSGSPI